MSAQKREMRKFSLTKGDEKGFKRDPLSFVRVKGKERRHQDSVNVA